MSCTPTIQTVPHEPPCREVCVVPDSNRDFQRLVFYDSTGANTLEFRVPVGLSASQLADYRVLLMRDGCAWDAECRRQRMVAIGVS